MFQNDEQSKNEKELFVIQTSLSEDHATDLDSLTPTKSLSQKKLEVDEAEADITKKVLLARYPVFYEIFSPKIFKLVRETDFRTWSEFAKEKPVSDTELAGYAQDSFYLFLKREGIYRVFIESKRFSELSPNEKLGAIKYSNYPKLLETKDDKWFIGPRAMDKKETVESLYNIFFELSEEAKKEPLVLGQKRPFWNVLSSTVAAYRRTASFEKMEKEKQRY